MSDTFHFELVSPEHFVFSGEVLDVIVPGSEGQFTVMAGHAPFIATLKAGIVHIHSATVKREFFVRGGFAEVTPAGLAILAEHAQPVEDIDLSSFDAMISDVRGAIADAANDISRIKAEERLTQLIDVKDTLVMTGA
jgi:F-type H+-transporting ATPase subunit epsilon